MKTCTKCGQCKDRSTFRRNARCRDGLSSWCGQCHTDATKVWRDRGDKWFHLYGITAAQRLALIEAQGHRCAICQRDDQPLGVDHDHQTGQVRGMLCTTCNTGLGGFRDRPERLASAIDYLAAPPATEVLGTPTMQLELVGGPHKDADTLADAAPYLAARAATV